MYLLKPLITLLFFINILSAQPHGFNLKYPKVTKASEIEEERYDKLEVYIQKVGYKDKYGQTWEQEFDYPEFQDDSYESVVNAFVAKALGIETSEINKNGFAHFTKKEDEYWLRLRVYAHGYSYVLLRTTPFPKTVKLSTKEPYSYTREKAKKITFPKNIAIPVIENFGIDNVEYNQYNEKEFFYNRDSAVKKGEFWEIDFKKSKQKDKDSYRYINAHSYKEEILKLGAKILKDEDNNMLFELSHEDANYFIKMKSYDSTFSVTIIKEEAFKQSLVLSPDKIKAELDREGKITLDGIYFDFDKATLKKESTKAILSTVALMQKYPDLVLSVQGHTDNKGDDNYNLKLSTARAKSVKDAIIANSIESERLTSKGFGEQKPVTTNDTDEGRAKNRRVELHKVSGGDKKALITIDFIKPLPNAVVDSKNSYKNDDLNIQYSKPYSEKKELKQYKGQHEYISYKIIKDGKVDESISRKAIIKNYENVLELYNAKIVGKEGNDLYFKINDRGDGKKIYGRISAYTGSYAVRFLIEE
ncbi:MAG: OmpA family protein [Epsilonproteobacteria bacterium]|nr:OmpA family protein [Campylobacterota bacterium]